jgi:dCTP deaminase
MLARPDAIDGQRIGSNYQVQGLKVSKHFRA